MSTLARYVACGWLLVVGPTEVLMARVLGVFPTQGACEEALVPLRQKAAISHGMPLGCAAFEDVWLDVTPRPRTLAPRGKE